MRVSSSPNTTLQCWSLKTNPAVLVLGVGRAEWALRWRQGFLLFLFYPKINPPPKVGPPTEGGGWVGGWVRTPQVLKKQVVSTCEFSFLLHGQELRSAAANWGVCKQVASCSPGTRSWTLGRMNQRAM